MRTGDVFLWKAYPYQNDGKIKNRWFVYLGDLKNDPFDDDTLIAVVAPTTTTQTDHYRPGEHREKHLTIGFTTDDGYGFEQDCMLDLSMRPAIWRKSEFREAERTRTILKKGELPTPILVRIYEKILLSKTYSIVEKSNIRRNLQGDRQLAQLPIPRRNRRK